MATKKHKRHKETAGESSCLLRLFVAINPNSEKYG